MKYPYTQIDENNIVEAISLFCSVIKQSHPMYNYLIPIREYDESLLDMRYVGRDAKGYGLFEAVPEPEEPTEPEQTEPEQTEPKQIVE